MDGFFVRRCLFMKVLSAQQMRDLEQAAVDNGETYIELMERAGTAAAEALISYGAESKRVVIICGKGNNGGDGYVIARILKKYNCIVDIIKLGEPRTADSKLNAEKAAELNIAMINFPENKKTAFELIKKADYIVDAVYGIGFRGALDETTAEIAKAVNDSKAFVMSVDVPSGAGCNDGSVNGECFKANLTVTFTTLKPAHILYPSMDYCGKTEVASVGISDELINSSKYIMQTTDEFLGERLLPERRISSNKGTFGTLLAVVGSYGMAGAAVMCGKAAQRSGAGLVNMALPKSIYPIVAGKLIEAVFTPLSEKDGISSVENCDKLVSLANKANAVVLGCGMGHNEDTEKIVCEILKNCEKPIILDADGINSVVPHIHLLKKAKAPIILTPHPGEMARLLGCTVAEVQHNRTEIALNFAKEHNVILILKGANTIISDGNILFVNRTGNAGMARGGSGDVLAGMIGSLAAQGMNPFRAAVCGVYAHGLAGDRTAKRLSETTMLPTDMIEDISF